MRYRLMGIAAAWMLGAILCISFQEAHAVIKADTPLKAIEGSMQYIFVGKVEKFFADKPAMVVAITEDIKGKAPFRNLPINCKVDDEKAAQENQIGPLMKRLGPDLDIVFFVAAPRGKNRVTFAFTNGTWFQLFGTQVGEKDQVVFSLKSAEPYYRKSFKGTTGELRQALKDYETNKTPLPALDSKAEPGLGPEYQPMRKSEGPRLLDVYFALNRPAAFSSPGTVFAVIPTLGIGAPLAILALLFPAVFGGVFVLFRQWIAFITSISINSTLMLLHYYWLAPTYLRGTWWGQDGGLWFLMTVTTFACFFWAWRRQLDFLFSGDSEAPQRTEQLVLLIMSSCSLVTAGLIWFFTKPSWVQAGWALTVVMTLGVLAGTFYKFGSRLKKTTAFASAPLTTEGIILGVMLVSQLGFATLLWGGMGATAGTVTANESAHETKATVAPVVKKWDFSPSDVKGAFVSPPLVHDDTIYAAFSSPAPLNMAEMVSLDRHTGQKKWSFIGKNDDLMEMISAPCIAEGKLFFGEGFHDDKNCKVYCVDAADGKEVWRFKTSGQTESSPIAANGKVYIGAGNAGVLCLDARDGKQLWTYPPAGYKGRLLRFGAGMCIVGNHLYCGTGVDRNQSADKGETAIFCFDADSGKLLWKTPAPYPVWSTPVVKNNAVYVTTGNGDVFADAEAPETPGGAVQCLDERTGDEIWRCAVGNGIMNAPAVDAQRVYFGCRDGFVYCVGRADGKPRWRRSLDSPVIGSPVLDCDPVYERTAGVFAAANAGKIGCLNPQTGEIVWTYDLTAQLACITTSPRLVVTPTAHGYRRQLYVGTGLGGAIREFAANRPVLYCLEDFLKVE